MKRAAASRSLAIAALLSAPLFVASPVLADGPSSSSQAQQRHPPLAQALKGDARVLYDSARDLFKAGDFVSAYAKFQRAFELSNDPRLYWNMAACERKVKHNANVLRLIDSYLREGEGWLSEDDKREATRAASAVRVFAASATVKTEPEDGVEIFVDDIRVATTPIDKPIWIDMGTHRVRFAKSGFRPVERSEDVPAGGDLSWSVQLERAGASTATPAAVTTPPVTTPPTPIESPPKKNDPGPPPSSSPSRVGPIVLGSIGLAALATGGAFAFVTTQEFSSLRDECQSSCERSRWTQYQTMQIVGDVLLIAGGAALIGGLVWWIALPSSSGAISEPKRGFLAPTPNGFVSGLVF